MPPDRRESLSSQLPGSWWLESRIDVTASGQRRPEPSLGEDPIAILIYDRSGHFAAQFMKRDRSDERDTVTQRLLGALSQENVGSVLTREMEVRGNTLVIELRTTSGDGVDVTRTLTWRRVG